MENLKHKKSKSALCCSTFCFGAISGLLPMWLFLQICCCVFAQQPLFCQTPTCFPFIRLSIWSGMIFHGSYIFHHKLCLAKSLCAPFVRLGRWSRILIICWTISQKLVFLLRLQRRLIFAEEAYGDAHEEQTWEVNLWVGSLQCKH